MQTVYESVVIWLNSILQDRNNDSSIKAFIIDLEMIPNWIEFPDAGLFSPPNDIRTEMIGGQRKHQEFKYFCLRMPFGEFQNRLSNEAFIENLEKCIYEKNQNGVYPTDGREWISIEVNSRIYPAQRDEANHHADYLVNLKLVYIQ